MTLERYEEIVKTGYPYIYEEEEVAYLDKEALTLLDGLFLLSVVEKEDLKKYFTYEELGSVMGWVAERNNGTQYAISKATGKPDYCILNYDLGKKRFSYVVSFKKKVLNSPTLWTLYTIEKPEV